MLQLLEYFGGIGAAFKALKKMRIPTKSLDYVDNDPGAVNSYNAMFKNEIMYKPQDIVNWSFRPDALVHGSPCQDVSPLGHRKGADEGSETRSSLMWTTLSHLQDFGVWRPPNVIWENVKGVRHKIMRPNFERYLYEMSRLGYSNSVEVLDARDFGLPQARERTFVVSTLGNKPFNFEKMQRKPMADIREFLLPNDQVDSVYDVTQPSIYNSIGKRGLRRATVIQDYAYTITTRQDRSPAQVIYCGNGRYRYLTELECWRLQGYDDADFYAAKAVTPKNGRFRMPLYKQSGNSIPVDFFESMFEVMF